MARKRESEYSKMKVAFEWNDWPVPTPQKFHHWTLARQVDQLVTARESEPDLGFMVRLMALCSLPRTNPGRRIQYKRVNGPYTLIMTATGNAKLPYGNLPRLLMAWISTEVVRTQSRTLILGRSLSEFMRKVGIFDDGGALRRRLRTQMDRLFHSTVSLTYESNCGKESVSSLVADHVRLWWDPKQPDEPVLWDSKIRLGEEFFKEILRRPLPIDLNILKGKRSSLGLARKSQQKDR